MQKKQSIIIHGHSTSYTLEPEFIAELKSIAGTRQISVSSLVCEIDENRFDNTSLSSAIRVYILRWLKDQNSPT